MLFKCKNWARTLQNKNKEEKTMMNKKEARKEPRKDVIS